MEAIVPEKSRIKNVNKLSNWFRGRRIVDLGELAGQLHCKQCCSLLDLNQTKREMRQGISSILHIVCLTCGITNEVQTFSNRCTDDEGVAKFTTTSEACLSMLLAGDGGQHILNFLAVFDIPTQSAEVISPTDSCTSTLPSCLPHETGHLSRHSSGCLSQKRTFLQSSPGNRESRLFVDCTAERIDCDFEQVENWNAPPKLDIFNENIAVEVETQTKKVNTSLVRVTRARYQNRRFDFKKTKDKEQGSKKDLVKDTEKLPSSVGSEKITHQKQIHYRCPICSKVLPSCRGFLIHLSRLHHRSDLIAEDHELKPESSSTTVNRLPKISPESESQNLADTSSLLAVNRSTDLTDRFKRSGCAFTLASQDDSSQVVSAGASLGSKSIILQSNSLLDNVASTKAVMGLNIHGINKERPKPHISAYYRPSKTLKCVRCCQDFSEGKTFRIHMRTRHKGERTYKCRTCFTAFATKSELTAHKKNKHANGCSCGVTCTECGDTLPNAHQLRKHKRANHPKGSKKVFTCEECHSQFSHLCFLKVHMRRHSGERPFKCHFCDKTFFSGSHRASHIRRNHTKIRKYLCETCGAGFYENKELRNHERKHTGERPFICRVCDRTFARETTLTIHLRQHSGERPYQCEHCGAAFVQIISLKTHCRKKHQVQDSSKEPTDKVVVQTLDIVGGSLDVRCPTSQGLFTEVLSQYML